VKNHLGKVKNAFMVDEEGIFLYFGCAGRDFSIKNVNGNRKSTSWIISLGFS